MRQSPMEQQDEACDLCAGGLMRLSFPKTERLPLSALIIEVSLSQLQTLVLDKFKLG